MLWEVEASPCPVAPLMPGVLKRWKLKCLSALPEFHSFHTLAGKLISKEWRKTERVKRGLAYSQLGNSETVCAFRTGAFDVYWFQPMCHGRVFCSPL